MRILVVDDERAVLALVRRSLEMDQHQVQTATNAAEALSSLGAGDFDLALVDLSLPEPMRGDELIREITRRKPDLPIVLMTGTTVSQALPGTALVLFKPFTLLSLRETIAIFASPSRPHPE